MSNRNPQPMMPDTPAVAVAQRNQSDLLTPLFAASLVLFLVVTVLAFQSSGPARVPMHVDGPVHDSVEGLSRSADVVAEVRIVGLVDRVVDHGGEKPLRIDPVDGEEISPDGLPVALFEVEVVNPVVGEAKRGQTLLVSLLDEKSIDSEHVVALDEDGRYLLFMARFPADTVGIDTGGEDVFLPLNYNNGVLPVRGDEVALNRWTLGLTEQEADERARELAELEAERGYEAVEAVLLEQEKVEHDLARVEEIARSAGR